MMSSRLIVVVPGVSGGLEPWQQLLARLQKEPSLKDARWFIWNHKRRWFSRVRARTLAVELRAHIDADWEQKGAVQEVILLGHSVGGLIARQAYLLGLGVDFETQRRSEWSPLVSRLVFFAAVNRGLNGLTSEGSFRLRLANWLFRVLPPLRHLLLYDLMRGSDFVANLRIEWIRHFQTLGDHAPLVVQLLGSRDELVKRSDSVDLEQFPTAWHVDIAEASHGDLIRLDGASDPDGRYALIRAAVINEAPEGGENKTIIGPENVVFVLHGIRANNRSWVHELAERIAARNEEVRNETLQVVTPTYGFISALRFALPTTRRKYLWEFQDEYTEYLAQNPQARFYFVGHSNGTYLFGQSLRTIPGMRFERAVLIGCVLPPDYRWQERVKSQQVRHIRNVRSNRDFPVSFLCSALRGLGMTDIGPGGYEGFNYTDRRVKEEVFWYEGGHSRPLDDEHLDALVEYVCHKGDDPPLPAGLTKHEIGSYTRWPRLAPWIARFLMIGIVALAAWWIMLESGFSTVRLAVLLGIGFLAYLVLDLY
jgi:pimeloyl-ACP methyl ester carboxylesterase